MTAVDRMRDLRPTWSFKRTGPLLRQLATCEERRFGVDSQTRIRIQPGFLHRTLSFALSRSLLEQDSRRAWCSSPYRAEVHCGLHLTRLLSIRGSSLELEESPVFELAWYGKRRGQTCLISVKEAPALRAESGCRAFLALLPGETHESAT